MHAASDKWSFASLPDGAKEKMLAENESKVATADVKFTENQNGDAKLDIGERASLFLVKMSVGSFFFGYQVKYEQLSLGWAKRN